MNRISATIVADSISPQGHRITSMELVMPRFILAEFNTHRMFSRNSASSRAIPFNKMVEMVKENPFIPIAWQEEHKGMQGSTYLTGKDVDNAYMSWMDSLEDYIDRAQHLNEQKVTKQLANRLLETFMYHKVLVTATEYINFFSLRAPSYVTPYGTFLSKKDALEAVNDIEPEGFHGLPVIDDELGWLQLNKGAAEIHMMDLAEKMWDAYNESKPKELKAGEWHIPYEDKIDKEKVWLYAEQNNVDFNLEDRWSHNMQLEAVNKALISIATGMAAQVSYTIINNEKNTAYETLIGIHDKMVVANPFHASPFEHCNRCMSDSEYADMLKGKLNTRYHSEYSDKADESYSVVPSTMKGWCYNMRGFIPYRYIIENK